MNMIFGIEEEVLKKDNSFNTAKEIVQQPRLWMETLEIFKENKEKLEKFFSEIGFDDSFKVIFTGAGTSEYVGNILEPMLRKKCSLDFEFKSIGTTDILNNPLNFLKGSKKTLIVSFARSGDSPESSAVIDIANDILDEVYHIFITCNKDGALAKMATGNKNIFLMLMPEESNDKGFAMTSSFSCMILAGMLLFIPDREEKHNEMKKIIEIVSNEMETKYREIKKLAEKDHKRIVILGSGILSGLSQELALKVMELSAGKVVAVSNTTLGFRHGPKAIVNEETIIFSLINEEEYAKKYDEDLLEEMYYDRRADRIVAYCMEENKKIISNTDKLICAGEEKIDKELAGLFVYLAYGQMYAFFKSQYLGNTTDNPFPTGEVNRVVKKFKVYKFEKE